MANDAPQAADSFAPGDEEGKNICDLDDCLLYYNQKNYAAALPGLVAASRKDNIKAKEILGLMYKAGQGVPKDIERAFDLLFSAAEQGSPLAQRYVGTMLSEGTGVRKNPVLALTWLEIATASTTGAAKKEVARDRDIVASQLSRQERQAALDNAKRWFARRGQGYLLKLNRQD
jgi:TPR repeat protein